MKKIVLSLLLVCVYRISDAQNIGIGTNAPHASSMIDITSNSKGLLIPRLTTTERNNIVSPADGLMVYDVIQRAFYLYKLTKGWRRADFDLPFFGTDSSFTSFRLENIKTTDIAEGINISVISNHNFSRALSARSKFGYGIKAYSDSGVAIEAVGYTGGIQASVIEGTGIPITASNFSTAPFKTAIQAYTNSPSGSVIFAQSNADSGSTVAVYGFSPSKSANSAGVKGEVAGGMGVYGLSDSGKAVVGHVTKTTGATTAIEGEVFSTDDNSVGVLGKSLSGFGINGVSTNGAGVRGQGKSFGVLGVTFASTGIAIRGVQFSTTGNSSAVVGTTNSPGGSGILGEAYTIDGIAAGVKGQVSSNSVDSKGVWGDANYGNGVLGTSFYGVGVKGIGNITGIEGSTTEISGVASGVYGKTSSTNNQASGVWGSATTGRGVFGSSTSGYGVEGRSNSNYGVYGSSSSSDGVVGETTSFGGHGVIGRTSSALKNGVMGINTSPGGYAVWGEANGGFNSVGVYGIGSIGVNGFTNTMSGNGVLGFAVNFGSIGVNAIGSTNAQYGLKASHVANGTAAYFSSNSSLNNEQLLIEETENDFARIKFKNNNGPVWVIAPYSSGTGSASAAQFNIYYSNLNNGTGSNALSLDGNANLTIAGNAFKPGGGSWNVPSDARLKNNITAFTSGLSIITQINPVSFNYNGKLGLPSQQNFIGVLAQDIQKIAPFMVKPIEGSAEGYLQFDPNALNYMLINAVKELSEENQRLKKEIEEIKKMILEIKIKQ